MTFTRPRQAGSPFEALARLIEECGGPKAVADFANKAPWTPYKWTDPDQGDGAPFGTVAQLTEHFGARAAAEHLALRAGGVFLPIPAADGAARWAELSAEAAEDMGALMADIVRALSPGSLGGAAVAPPEAARILTDIDEMFRHLAALRALAGAAADGREGAR